MSEWITEVCEEGVREIWMQCDASRFPGGVDMLEQAAWGGDPEGWYFLGVCNTLGDGGTGFHKEKAYDCFIRAVRGGSCLAVLGAIGGGHYDAFLRRASLHTAAEALEKVKEQAEAGFAMAAWQLARTIEGGDLKTLSPEDQVPADKIPPAKDCFKWYEKAAEAGIVRAMEKVARCYKEGIWTDMDEEKFLSWTGKCAEAGSAWGLCEYGFLYLEEGDDANALACFRAADIQGEERALIPLGRLCLAGKGGRRDVTKAVKCFEKAAELGQTLSFLELGHLFYRDEAVERDDEQAFYWYEKAYDAGHKAAALPLGHLLMREGASKDPERALELFREAAESEDRAVASEACITLGNICRDGILGTPDPAEAISWYEKGAALGSAECMELIGLIYYQGEDGIRTDFDQAFYWLDRCYQNGTLQSCSKLATLYLNGQGCTADEEKAEALYLQATRTEFDGYAFYQLGYIRERNGSSQALEQAMDYYRQAAEMGYEGAAERLTHFRKNLFGRWKVNY